MAGFMGLGSADLGYSVSKSKGKGQQPQQPDYMGLAKMQGEENRKSALQSASLSNPNVNNPYGSQTVTWNGDQATVNQQLDPTQQGLLNRQNEASTSLSGMMPGMVSSVQSAYGNPNDASSINQLTQQAQDSINARLNPGLQQQSKALDQQLANQGIGIGTEAWNNAKRQQGNQENDAHQQAVLAALNYSPALLQQQQTLRNAPLQELSQVRGLSSPTVPTFQGYTGSNVAAAPYMQGGQLQGQAMTNQFNLQQANQNSMQQGLFGLGAAALMSDIRLKEDIKRVGTTDGGLPVYTYRYKGMPNTHMGVMAQEVEKVNPGAVREIGGFKAVDYSMIK
jgi:hypothetical protein